LCTFNGGKGNVLSFPLEGLITKGTVTHTVDRVPEASKQTFCRIAWKETIQKMYG